MKYKQLISDKKIIVAVISVSVLVVSVILFFALTKNNGQATLTWNPNTEANLAGYKVYYGTEPRKGDCPDGGYLTMIEIGKDPTYQFKNLGNNSTYYFSVTSYNSTGKESCFSGEVKKFTAVSLSDRFKSILPQR